jgi:hypothetical protein
MPDCKQLFRRHEFASVALVTKWISRTRYHPDPAIFYFREGF